MNLTAIRSEGGLLTPDTIGRILRGELGGQAPKDFGFRTPRELSDDIASAWGAASRYWAALQARLERLGPGQSATPATRETWLIPLLETLGYTLTFQRQAVEAGGTSFPISHRAGDGEDAPPVHLEGVDIDLDRRAPERQRRRSPQTLLQDYLNRSEHLWGIVSNGKLLRLVRQNPKITRPAYVEFDLATIFDGGKYDEFVVLYRLLHRSRLPRGAADAAECWLERYFQEAVAQGGRVRERLREGVEEALRRLGNGLLGHPRNEALRSALASGELSSTGFYQELLRLVYRLLFLMVAEERGMIVPSGPGAERSARLYAELYGVERLRLLCARPWEESPYGDLWLGLQETFRILEDRTDGPNPLGVPPLNGGLFGPEATPHLDGTRLYNHELLAAMWSLSFFRDEQGVVRRVNYEALDVEELGSVYESLLDYAPEVRFEGGRWSFDLVPGTERKSTGSYYTPPELVQELVDHALVPVLDRRLQEAGLDQDAREEALLSLKVCDLACGSGHFLLAVARRLGRELARIRTGEEEPTPDEFRRAVRVVTERCIYGVDKNPLAVDLCKLSLWIEGHYAGRPLSFLDHRIRCGDSLVGALDMDAVAGGVPDSAYAAVSDDDRRIARTILRQNARERDGQQRLQLGDGAVSVIIAELLEEHMALAMMPEQTAAQVRAKAERYREAHGEGGSWWRAWSAANLWTAAFFSGFTRETAVLVPTTHDVQACLDGRPVAENKVHYANSLAQSLRFFHWPLEFPEVLEGGGFDVIIGNPPFLGGGKITGTFGERYLRWLKGNFPGAGGRADLCAYFFQRAFAVLRTGGRLGLLATNTIAQGDTRQAGLDVLCEREGHIMWAVSNRPWPGEAALHIAEVIVAKGEAYGDRVLDGRKVEIITPALDDGAGGIGQPAVLQQNERLCYQGSILQGTGFILEPDEAWRLIEQNPRNADCLFPYLTGEDINSRPDHSPSRWVINFFDWTLEEAERYPELLQIVRDRVKPQRDRVREGRGRRYWWLFLRPRPELHRSIAGLSRVLVASIVTSHWAPVFFKPSIVFSHRTVVFALERWQDFALLQSSIHELWARKYSSTLETRLNYAPSDCFDTFPFPQDPDPEVAGHLEEVGRAYYEHREAILRRRQIGLTTCYNLFHDPNCQDEDIRTLREHQVEMDRWVARAYGWWDLVLGHGFHPHRVTGETRFTLAPDAQNEVLRRLLALNQAIAKEEARQSPRRGRARKAR